jgi:replicative DNA helicase Mcm
MDPGQGELDAEAIKTGSKEQRDSIEKFKTLIVGLEEEYDEGAPIERVLERAEQAGMERSEAKHKIDKLKQKVRRTCRSTTTSEQRD